MCTLVLSFISTGIFIIEQELFITNNMRKFNDDRFWLLCLGWVINILVWWNIFVSYKLYINLLQNEWRMYSLDDLLNSGLWKTMLVEMMINCIGPVPFLYKTSYSDSFEGDFKIAKTYSNTPLLWAALVIRLYHLVAFALENSDYMNARAYRVTASMGVRAGYGFAFKSIFRENALKVVACVVIVTAIIFGYMFRICETPIRHFKPGAPPMNVKNSIWCAIVSMTTVGYGDVVPFSGTGSYIGLFCSMIGIQTTSFFLISYQNFLSFEPAQAFSYELINNIEQADEIRMRAKNHIVSYYKWKHRGTKRGKYIFKKTHSNTLSCSNVFRMKWVEFHNYVRAFNLFRNKHKSYTLFKIQQISSMDL